ncbi:MAG: alpha/beta hydrolase [Verrucomicrobia bacterium]|nr:alpha/beta hydrolase [Verrucomicrobiota bacterium]
MKPRALIFTSLFLLGSQAFAAETPAKATSTPKTEASAKAEPKERAQPKPTLAEVPYGAHERQVLNFWKAASVRPTPVLFFIHGGGWVTGDKARVANLEDYLAAGISVVSINYRYVTQAILAGVKPPVQWPLHDAARALQFVRSKAAEWNLDRARIGASGGSAGACSSLWLAFHDDRADPRSSDPIARESTRLWCAAVTGAQTTLDPQQMKEWTPNSRYGGHAFGFMPDPNNTKTRDTQFAEFLAARDQVLPWIKEYSPFEHVSADDPPIYMIYAAPPALGQDQKDPTHTANFGVKLQEKLGRAGVACELVYPGAPDVKHPAVPDYLIAQLKAPARRKTATR